jgi:hypothetical protein
MGCLAPLEFDVVGQPVEGLLVVGIRLLIGLNVRMEKGQLANGLDVSRLRFPA